ncbi:MAG TPA: SDR family NAD(P)-dependent oxidoreductase [Hyphomicrobiaceae bacterium]|jgi:NAD(P)-dependent dehydrogenase (short-subunit alcohol dehydrogenase family)
MNLTGQVVLVTGAGQGIGKACALAMAKAGADVATVDINGESVKETADAIIGLGRRSLALRADLGSVADIDRMIGETIAAFGRIDTLVNNAGVTRRADIMDLTEEDWDRTHRVNAKGVFFCLQRAARDMIPRRSGRIINIASIAGKGYAGTSNAIYAASKGAVISLTKTAAQQLGPYNINVNAVCPGIVRTAMWREINRVLAEKEGRSPEEVEAGKLETVPIRRANEPEDIADMVVFLASPASRNVTGQAFNVDGGLVPH